MMEYASGNLSLKEVIANKESLLENSAWCKEGKKLLKDAWGEDLIVKLNDRGDDIVVLSRKIRNEQRG